MAHDDALYNVFSTEDLWKPSGLYEELSASVSSLFRSVDLDVPSIKLKNPYAPTTHLDQELRLPDLEDFEFGNLPGLETPDLSTTSTEPIPQQEDEAIWQLALQLGPVNKDVVFFTWEAFENTNQINHHSPYISEAGPEAFDAAIALHTQNNKQSEAGRCLRPDILLDSLLNLGLGRSSIFFAYDTKRKTFVPTLAGAKASGYSLAAVHSLIEIFLANGNAFIALKSFVERTYASSNMYPARVAFASAITAILSTFEDYLGRHSEAVTSLLQLQRLFRKPHRVLLHIVDMIQAIKAVVSNEELVSILYLRIESMDQSDDDLRLLSIRILARVAEPSLQLVSEWIGLQTELTAVPFVDRANFVTLADTSDSLGPPEYSYNPENMPRFLSDDDGRLIFDIGNSLRFIRSHHPGHPLASTEKLGIAAPDLQWNFSWQDVETVIEKAKTYQEALYAAVQASGTDTTLSSPSPSYEEKKVEDVLASDFNRYLIESVKLFDGTPQPSIFDFRDDFRLLITRMLSDDDDLMAHNDLSIFSPPLSITPRLSFGPILAAQARLVNATTLRLFFRSHELRTHLLLQRQYHLLGDGVFSSRLASSLFSPDLEAAERQKGRMRSGVHMGLQVGSRTTWPPASSELRLALMGILSESYYSSRLYSSTNSKKSTFNQQTLGSRDREELPGQLAFAVRTLIEPEMEKIMNPNSLYALDFLRLQYVPPSPLNLVITTAALEKYDYIFKFLLRLLRMLFVVSHLPREYYGVESRRFRNEAHHFVATLSTYIFQTGIDEHWATFESFVDTIEKQLVEEDAAGEMGVRVKEGLESIKAAHDQCLDSIMFSLFLRRRQKKVLSLLEEIFELILLFSRLPLKDSDDFVEGKEDIKDLYARFKGKIRVFISVCRGLTGKRGYGKGRGTSEENTIERLLIGLEMNGYYNN